MFKKCERGSVYIKKIYAQLQRRLFIIILLIVLKIGAGKCGACLTAFLLLQAMEMKVRVILLTSQILSSLTADCVSTKSSPKPTFLKSLQQKVCIKITGHKTSRNISAIYPRKS